MKNPNRSKVWKVALALSALNLFQLSNAHAEVAVIVHPDNDSTFDQTTIKNIFLGKAKAFSNGRSALLLSPENSSATAEEFNSNVIGKSSSQFKAYWSKILFTGKGTPPKEMPTAQEIINSVSSNPDAIAYVDASEVNGSVKVVAKF
ncbi:substrate-binding domain-containing protein [Pseudoalteromonas sp. T1lg65]|uniref:substrate-binding domain-containing protein n=1 Tax=Pseudoalteromonas sp. T1lg65 TaxID=2077101 RepID=UPI003F7942CA